MGFYNFTATPNETAQNCLMPSVSDDEGSAASAALKRQNWGRFFARARFRRATGEIGGHDPIPATRDDRAMDSATVAVRERRLGTVGKREADAPVEPLSRGTPQYLSTRHEPRPPSNRCPLGGAQHFHLIAKCSNHATFRAAGKGEPRRVAFNKGCHTPIRGTGSLR